jgi:hypothetical protein
LTEKHYITYKSIVIETLTTLWPVVSGKEFFPSKRLQLLLVGVLAEAFLGVQPDAQSSLETQIARLKVFAQGAGLLEGVAHYFR